MTIIERLRQPEIEALCKRWRVRELAVFGSVADLRDQPDSDVDLLVSFDDEASWSLLDHASMQDELETLLGREVDLLTRPAVERSRNTLRRQAILDSAETIYVA